MPKPFSLQWIGTNELGTEYVFEHVGNHRCTSATRRNRHTVHAFISAQKNYTDFTVRWATTQAVTPYKWGVDSRRKDREGLDFSDSHVFPQTSYDCRMLSYEFIRRK